MASYFINALILLAQIILSIYIYVLLLRFILQKQGANYFNPIIQVLVKLSDFSVKPVRKMIPAYRGYDIGIVILVIIAQLISVLIPLFFVISSGSAVWGILVMMIAEIGKKLVAIYFVGIIVQAISSWAPSLQHSPMAEVVYLLCEPVLRPARRLIPAISGIDLSPIAVLIVLQLINYLLLTPLAMYGFNQLAV